MGSGFFTPNGPCMEIRVLKFTYNARREVFSVALGLVLACVILGIMFLREFSVTEKGNKMEQSEEVCWNSCEDTSKNDQSSHAQLVWTSLDKLG